MAEGLEGAAPARRRLLFIADARLPTEKAHGLNITKTCESFAREGFDVELWHASRRQGDASMRGRCIFDYYDVDPTFSVKTLRNIDVVPWEERLPTRLFAVISNVRNHAWAAYAAALARRHQPDMVFTRDIDVAFWLDRLSIPTILELHSVPQRTRRQLLTRIFRRRNVLIIALTSFTRDEVVAMGADRARVLELGGAVDVAAFRDVPSGDLCRQRLGLPNDAVIIGYVGRFETMGQEKGIADLVRAAAHVSAGDRPVLFVCVGGPRENVGAYLDIARATNTPESQLRFVDHVPRTQIPMWLGAFDVAVMPFPNRRHYAAYMSPMKMFEYMAAGLPIVASDLPAVRKVLRHGENAWLVPPDNPRALAEGLTTLLGNEQLRLSLAQRAASDVEEHSWERRAATIARFSDTLAAARHQTDPGRT